MSKVVIIYSSMGGNTEKMAEAVRDGALSAGAIASLKKAQNATAEDVCTLIRIIKKEVKNKYGISLTTELRTINKNV